MFLYNTVCTVVLYDWLGDAAPLLDGCERLAEDVRQMLDIYDENSELSRLNREGQSGRPVELNTQLYTLLRQLDTFSRLSEGAFDITVGPLMKLWDFTAMTPAPPSPEALRRALGSTGYSHIHYDDARQAVTFTKPGVRLDAGGAGKGYALGLVAEFLRENKVVSAGLDFGGNLYLLGPAPTGAAAWQVGVQSPWASRGHSVGSLSLRDTAVATSGGYDRCFEFEGKTYHHILDPRTGRPVENELGSVTIICDEPLYTDLVSTAFFVLGPQDGHRLVQRLRALPVPGASLGYMAVTENGAFGTAVEAGIYRPAGAEHNQ